MRFRVVIGALAAGAALVAPLGVATSAQAASTPAQVVTRVHNRVVQSVAAAHKGVRGTENVSNTGVATTFRYDGTRNRYREQNRIVTAVYVKGKAYRFFPDAAGDEIRKLVGVGPRTFVRYLPNEEGVVGPRYTVNALVRTMDPTDQGKPRSASVKNRTGGGKVFRITWGAKGDRVGTWTTDRQGRIVRWTYVVPGFGTSVVTLHYAKQTVRIPASTMSWTLWNQGVAAYFMPTNLQSDAEGIAAQVNDQPPPTLAGIRELAIQWRANWTGEHPDAPSTLTMLSDGVRMSFVQPFSNKAFSVEVAIVGGQAVVR